MVTPWDLDSMRSDSELPFVSAGVPIEGDAADRGLHHPRVFGLAVTSGCPFTLGLLPWVERPRCATRCGCQQQQRAKIRS